MMRYIYVVKDTEGKVVRVCPYGEVPVQSDYPEGCKCFRCDFMLPLHLVGLHAPGDRHW